MPRFFENICEGRRKKIDVDMDPTVARRLIKAVDRSILLKGINIQGHYRGLPFQFNKRDPDFIYDIVRGFFSDLRQDETLAASYQVFSGWGTERHYFDFHSGSYIAMPTDEGPARVMSPIDITIDYLVRTV